MLYIFGNCMYISTFNIFCYILIRCLVHLGYICNTSWYIVGPPPGPADGQRPPCGGSGPSRWGRSPIADIRGQSQAPQRRLCPKKGSIGITPRRVNRQGNIITL